jgi:hypothetical protein
VDPKSKPKKKTIFCFSWQARLLVVNYQIPTLDEHNFKKKKDSCYVFCSQKKRKKKREFCNKWLLTDEQQVDV